MFLYCLKTRVCNVLHKDVEVRDDEPVAGGLALCIREMSEYYQESITYNSDSDLLSKFPGSVYPPCTDFLFGEYHSENSHRQMNESQSSTSSRQFSNGFTISSSSMNGDMPSPYSSVLNEDVLVFSTINS